jgi:hypothetical protein
VAPRLQLASDSGLKSCTNIENAFASKPAPTVLCGAPTFACAEDPCRSWLASDSGLETCIGIENAFAGKPAPTDCALPFVRSCNSHPRSKPDYENKTNKNK